MSVAEMIEAIGYAELDIIVVTPVGRFNYLFDTDHVSEDEDIYYLEDSDGRPLELNKNSEVRLEEDGVYSINRGDCLLCIKLNV